MIRDDKNYIFRPRTIPEFALWVKGKTNPPCCGILIHRRDRSNLGRVTCRDVRSAGAREIRILAAQSLWVGSGLYPPALWWVHFQPPKVLEDLSASGGSF
jgi:hypothetical protein